MYARDKILEVYLELADQYQRQQDPGMREIFLLLAAEAALKANRPAQAEQLRLELLRENPHHALKPYQSFADALRHPDIENYLADLQEKYPIEVAQDMLGSVLPATLPPAPPGVPLTPDPTPRNIGQPPAGRSPANVPVSPPEDAEPFKVYREPDVAETLAPPQRPNPRPARSAGPQRQVPQPAPQPAPPRPRQPAVPPTTRPRPAVTRPPATPPSRSPQRNPTAAPEDEKLAPGAWVGTVLFMLVLAVGVALTLLTLFPQELLEGLGQGS